MENIESILKTVIDSNDDVWFFVAPDFSILYFNKKAFENGKLWHNRELTTGDSLLDYARDTQNEVDKSLLINFNKALQGEHICHERKVDYASVPASTWIQSKYNPVYRGDILIGVSITISDISRQKQMEEDEQRTKQHVEHLLKRREEFTSITSHELKTPIAGIKGFIQLLEKRSAEENLPYYQRILGKANEQIDKLTHMVDDLLDLTRIETGKLKLEISSFLIQDLINDCLSMIQPASHPIVTEGDTAIRIEADKTRIEQVICNLVANAVKYSSPESKVTISVSNKNENVYIAIIDHGVGIPPEKVDSLFIPFYRSDESNLNKSGLGLGLYIAYQIVESHKGKIEVESKVDEGSTFTIILPKRFSRG